MDALTQQLAESTLESNPPSDFSPFCVQRHVQPKGELRFIVVYMRNDAGTACEAFPAAYSGRYLDVGQDPAAAARAVVPAAAERVPDSLLLELRHLTLSVVTFMRKAHELQLDGIALEFIQDEQGALMLHAMLGSHVTGGKPSWSMGYDMESKLIHELVGASAHFRDPPPRGVATRRQGP